MPKVIKIGGEKKTKRRWIKSGIFNSESYNRNYLTKSLISPSKNASIPPNKKNRALSLFFIAY
jgi:hypothetical protein